MSPNTFHVIKEKKKILIKISRMRALPACHILFFSPRVRLLNSAESNTPAQGYPVKRPTRHSREILYSTRNVMTLTTAVGVRGKLKGEVVNVHFGCRLP